MIVHHRHELSGSVFWVGFWLTMGAAFAVNLALTMNAAATVATDRLDRWWNALAAISEPARPKAPIVPLNNN